MRVSSTSGNRDVRPPVFFSNWVAHFFARGPVISLQKRGFRMINATDWNGGDCLVRRDSSIFFYSWIFTHFHVFQFTSFLYLSRIKSWKKETFNELKILNYKEHRLGELRKCPWNTGKAAVNPEGNIFRYEIKFINTHYFPFNLILQALVSRQLAAKWIDNKKGRRYWV